MKERASRLARPAFRTDGRGKSWNRTEGHVRCTPENVNWVIETKGLERTFRLGATEVRALRGVDVQIAHGAFVALMGPSGSGKSTLMHLLGCLDTATRGQYWLEGRDVSTLSADERAHVRSSRIGFVFQSFNLLTRLTALENVALPLLYQGKVSNTKGRALEALERVGLGSRTSHHPTELSGGECQRLAIARALVTEPAIILADEPTGNLDSVSGAGIMQLLGDLNAEGRTLLVVTHEAKVAAHAERILHVYDGRIVKRPLADGRAVQCVAGSVRQTAVRTLSYSSGVRAAARAPGHYMA